MLVFAKIALHMFAANTKRHQLLSQVTP